MYAKAKQGKLQKEKAIVGTKSKVSHKPKENSSSKSLQYKADLKGNLKNSAKYLDTAQDK